MPVAVVIPTLDEEAFLPRALSRLCDDPPCPLEVIVADGGSRDATVALARRLGARVVEAGRAERAAQMNAGAAATGGDPILFLHADVLLGREHLEAMLAALDDPRVACGSFPIRIEAQGAAYALISAVANLRTRLDRTPYGDQALFVRRSAFAATGGYPEVPILEEVLLSRRLRPLGRYVFLPGPPVAVSARRWRRDGVVRTTLRNWATRALFELGAPPERLRGFYDRRRQGAGRLAPRAHS